MKRSSAVFSSSFILHPSSFLPASKRVYQTNRNDRALPVPAAELSGYDPPVRPTSGCFGEG
jgi:hypothetical protein